MAAAPRPEWLPEGHFRFGHHVRGPTGVEIAPYRWPDLWWRDQTNGPTRLVVGPSHEHIDTVLALAATLQPPLFPLFVLLESIAPHRAGRYQGPAGTFDQIAWLLRTHRTYLEADGRHQLWVGEMKGPALIVYDEHDVLYAYGDLPAMEALLAARGLRPADGAFPWFPNPHTHQFIPSPEAALQELMGACDWSWSPLQPDDVR